MSKIGIGLFAATLILGAGASRAQDITIAVVGPMTGQYASFGEQLRRGATQAVADINAKGGVLGRQLKLEIGDDACDPRQAVAVANQLAGKKVSFVAGHFCSGSSIPASEVYAEEGILQISPGSTNPVLTERGDKYRNVFRVCSRDDTQGVVAGTYLATIFKGKNIAILHDKSAYGKGVADETRKVLNKSGQPEKLYEAINQGDKDFTALVSKMKSASIDAIYYGGYYIEAGLLIRQAREQGLQAQLLVPDAVVTQEFWAISGPAGEGTLMTFPPDPRKFAAAKEAVAAFKKNGFDPEGYTLYTYAAVQAFAAAAEQAKSTKADDLGKALKSHKLKTVLDEISFDAKGDVIGLKHVFYIWKDGTYLERES